jgi:hypothetical protein
LTDGGDGQMYGVMQGNGADDSGAIVKISILGVPKPPTNVRLTPR